jgi:hypothetical protein
MDAFADGLVWGLAAFWFTDRVLVWLDRWKGSRGQARP